MIERTCNDTDGKGGCVVCCFYASFDEGGVSKQALEPCSKLKNYKDLIPECVDDKNSRFYEMPLLSTNNYRLDKGDNCTIYKNRPNCCIDYRCAWLNGYGDQNDRPDKCGMLFDDISPTGIIDNALIAKPLWFGAEEEEKGIRAIDNMSKSKYIPVLVLQFTEFKLLKVIGRGT